MKPFNKHSIYRKPRTRGQATIEFVVALPILLLLIFGIIDFALLFQAWLSVQNIARQTLRYAVTGEYDSAYCVDLNGDGVACAGTSPIPSVARAQKEAEEDVARLDSIHAVADTYVVGLMTNLSATQLQPGFIQITICGNNLFFPPKMGLPHAGEYSRCIPAQDAGSAGEVIFVSVDFNHPGRTARYAAIQHTL
jgi:hypothetical protein